MTAQGALADTGTPDPSPTATSSGTPTPSPSDTATPDPNPTTAPHLHSLVATPVTYSISGHVGLFDLTSRVSTPAGSGVVTVQYRLVGDTALISGGVTDSNGAYTILGLASGSYELYFQDNAGGYSSEWYGDVDVTALPHRSLTIATSNLTGIDAQLPQSGILRGSVTLGSSSLPAQDHEVAVTYSYPNGSGLAPWSAPAYTDASGNFAFPPLAPSNNYVLHFSYLGTRGFQGGYDGVYGIHPWSATATSHSVNPQYGDTHVYENLPELSTITGQVTLGNSSTPAPAGSVTVTLSHHDLDTGLDVADGSQPVDASGGYHFAGLLATGYSLVFTYTGGPHYLSRSTGSVGDAYGQNVSAMVLNETIAPAYTVSGHVAIGDADQSATSGEVQLSFYDGDSDPIYGQIPVPVATTQTDAAGNWSVSDLPGGNYIVSLHDTLDPSVPDQVMPRFNTTNCIYHSDCSVKVSSDLVGVDTVLVVRNSIAGRVTLDSGAPVSGVSVSAHRFDPTNGSDLGTTVTTTAADGTYSFPLLYDGSYAISFTSPSPDLAFQWFDDESTYYLPDPITVADGDTVTAVDAMLHRAATISGSVTTPGGSSADVTAGNVSVEVVVYDYQSHTWVQTGDAYPVALSGGVARYSIPGLAPDTYRLRFLYDGNAGSALLVSPRITVTAGSTTTYDARVNVSGLDSTDVGLDGITGSKQGITVSGWAVEPGSPSTHVGLALNVGSNWYSVNADQPSADAVEAEADYVAIGSDHGFAGTIPFAPGTYNACLWTSEPAGHASVLVACQTVTVAPQARTAAKIDAMTGSLTGLSFSGYALFPDNDAAAVGVAINIGSSWYGFTANQHNAEGASDVSGAGTEHGFAGTIPLPQGTYTACLWVSEPTGPAANAGCRTVVIPAQRPAASHIDSVTGGLGTVSVTGWDLFPDVPSTSVGLAINIGASWYSMTANGTNSGPLATFPSAGSNHGFAATVPAPTGAANVCIWTVEPSGPAVNIGCRTVTVTAPRPAVTRIDAVTGGLGTLTVSGWDVFPDSLSAQVGLAINIGASWYSMTANTPNAGSASAYPASTVDHGYTSTLAMTPGTYNVCIWTVEPSGPAVNTGCRTVTVAAPRPAAAHIDSVTGGLGTVTATGWDLFPDAPSTSVGLALNIGASWYSMTANGANNESLAPFPAAGGNHGFTTTVTVPPGTYSACVWTVEPSGPAANIGCTPVTVRAPRAAVTSIDSITTATGSLTVSGWDVFPDSLSAQVGLAINIGASWYSMTANTPNAGSASAYPASTVDHGYTSTLAMTPGTYNVCIWTVEPSGPAVNTGCRTVTVPAVPPAVTGFPLFTGGVLNFTVKGSDYFPDSPSTSVHLAVSLDDGTWTSVTADQPWPGLPVGGDHGFSATIPSPAGHHTACLWTTEPTGNAVNVGCHDFVVANAQGVAAGFDAVLATKGGLTVFGYSEWLFQPDVHPNVSANIGSHWYPFTADQENFSETGHGVKGFIPIAPGNYTVCLWTSQPNGTALNLGCRAASAYSIAG